MPVTIAIPKFNKDQFRKFMQSKYTASLRRAGAKAVWIEADDLEKAISHMLKCDGLLLSGGEDVNPKHYGQTPTEKCGEIVDARDHAEMEMLKAFLSTGRPILGICRGEQLMNVYFGGTLHQDIADLSSCKHDDYAHKDLGNHTVTLTPGSKLAKIMGQKAFPTNSLHHQAVDKPGEGLLVSAVSEDGMIEAIEHTTHRFCIGVQWHPEHMVGFSKRQRRIFDAFVRTCKE